MGGPSEQADFLNGCVLLDTSLTPAELMNELRKIEAQHGRQRRVRWAARTLDLDLLLYGEQVIEENDREPHHLQIPHPRMTFRPFVIGPAAEVAPQHRHPLLGATIAELNARLNTGTDQAAFVGGSQEQRASVKREISRIAPGVRVSAGPHSAGPHSAGSPKLQICFDDTPPMPGTPALWLPADDAQNDWSELHAAIACLWPA